MAPVLGDEADLGPALGLAEVAGINDQALLAAEETHLKLSNGGVRDIKQPIRRNQSPNRTANRRSRAGTDERPQNTDEEGHRQQVQVKKRLPKDAHREDRHENQPEDLEIANHHPTPTQSP